jgi:cardiolipin synthase
VPYAVDAVRLARVAGARLPPPAAVPRPVPLAARFDATIAASAIAGNRVEIELDNAKARRWLLAAIESSTRRVHVQVYMAADDDVGRQIESALTRAGERAVTVRALVDSLHGFHGSFGVHNPLLDRLGSRRGIEVRVSQPITTPQSMWREVPWLDAGARVEGPAVGALEHSFLEAWTEAGGAPFDVADVAPVGPTPVRVVIHRGLRDAYTLETYLALIETARTHVYVVNGFPLILEIQHALLRALRRGVRVRTLFGQLTPTHGGEPFTGPWASARAAATQLVHSRMDALIAAGGRAISSRWRSARRGHRASAPSLLTCTRKS